MGVEVVAHQLHSLAVAVATLQQGGHFLCPVHFLPLRAYPHSTLTCQRFGEYEQAGCPRSFVFVIDPFFTFERRWVRHASFSLELHRLFVHADERMSWFVRSRVGGDRYQYVCGVFGGGRSAGAFTSVSG